MKINFMLAALFLIGSTVSRSDSESDQVGNLIGVWVFKSSEKHYSRRMESDYFFGEKDELRFFKDEGVNGSIGVTLRSKQRKSSIGDLYLIWAEEDQRGLVLKFGSNQDPITFIGSSDATELRFEFVSHGETRIEYCFERLAIDPGDRPKNTQ
jgi:hypothetical protein